MNLLDEAGRPHRSAIALFGRPDYFGSEYTALGCHLAAVEGVHLGPEFGGLRGFVEMVSSLTWGFVA